MSKLNTEWVMMPRSITAAMCNAWIGETAFTTDEELLHSGWQDAWDRVIAALSPAPWQLPTHAEAVADLDEKRQAVMLCPRCGALTNMDGSCPDEP